MNILHGAIRPCHCGCTVKRRRDTKKGDFRLICRCVLSFLHVVSNLSIWFSKNIEVIPTDPSGDLSTYKAPLV